MANRCTGIVTLLAATWLAITGASATAADETTAARAPYALNPGDVLQISVWKEQDLQREVLIRPDGHFSFPLAGDVAAEGKSIEEVTTELTERLSRYIPDLVVTVAVLQLNGNKIYVLGQVNRPGEFPIGGNADVMQALGMAGGPTTFAKLDDIRILRRTGDSQIAVPFRYSDVENGRKLEQNILLRAGDTIVVP